MRLLPTLKYPKARRSSVTENIHGINVEDPYRWMEDPDAEETRQFVRDENIVTNSYLAGCGHHKEDLTAALKLLWTYERTEPPRKVGDFYYYRKSDGIRNQFIMYRSKAPGNQSAILKHLKINEEVFLDPNEMSKDGSISVSDYYPSKRRYFAYTISDSGSDWKTVRIRDTETGRDLPDKVERVRYTDLAWTSDEQGFFYGRYPESEKSTGTNPNVAENQKVFYHRVGTDQTNDVLIAEFPEHPKWRSNVEVSDDGKTLIINVRDGLVNERVYRATIPDVITDRLKLQVVRDKFDCQLGYVTNDGDTFYWYTDLGMPNFGIVKMDINKPAEISTVLAEDPKRVLDDFAVRGDKLIVKYIEDVVSALEIFNLNGQRLHKVPVDVGNAVLGDGSRNSSEVFFEATSFQQPGVVYRFEIDSPANIEEFRRVTLPKVSTDSLVTEQKFFKSRDGTRVPMFVMRRAGHVRPSPTLLRAYGGFNFPYQPQFSLFDLLLVYAMGFMVSYANVRGGGEYGRLWHDGGRLANKQNTIDDVHAAARYLIDSNYTTARQLAMTGRSNGGLVTLASINQQPQLFRAAIAGVPVADLMRFHKFTVGHAWTSEYGNPENASEFEFIRKLSPLHNIPSNISNYPALLVTTADHDDRVVPSHSLKFIAELQHKLGERNDNPLLTLVDTKAGHGSGKPIHKKIEDYVNDMCFLSLSMGLDFDDEALKALRNR